MMAEEPENPIIRSELMVKVQLFIQSEAAHDTVEELGHVGLVQFNDMNPDVTPFHRRFVNEVKRVDEMGRKLRFFSDQCAKADLELGEPLHDMGSGDDLNLDNLEHRFTDLEREIKQMGEHEEQLIRRENELTELQNVLQKASVFFGEKAKVEVEFEKAADEDARDDTSNAPLLAQDEEARHVARSSVTLGSVSGVAPRSKMQSFERVLWRATRGNLFMKQTEIEAPIKDPNTGEKIEKNVFIIFYQGERARVKISRICESFGANLYQCPETSAERMALKAEVDQQLLDTSNVVQQTLTHRRQMLTDVAMLLPAWMGKLKREKGIYHTMNLFNFDVTNKVFIGEGWVPKYDAEAVQLALRRATERSGALVPSILHIVRTKEEPPTYHKTNKVTKPFQALVDAYGVCRYREVNPAILMTATLPFLFAVMYGDVGHGIILFLATLYMVLKEKKMAAQKKGEILNMMFSARYMLMIMALMSIYTGFLYNECFSLPMAFFNSNWNFVDEQWGYRNSDAYAYPIGVDYAWNGAVNELTFYNSMKMKMSMILGITQMTLGIVFHFMNGREYKKPLDIWFEFIPRMVFMLSFFGYMLFCIMFKWAKVWENTHLAPSIVSILVGMAMSTGKITPETRLYEGQEVVETVLVLCAVVSVPIMLFVKPFILRRRHHAQVRRTQAMKHAADDGAGVAGGTAVDVAEEPEEPAPFNFGEIMITQALHTIEFVLGCISNTASYLRLWALSLAHSMLSKVFYDMILKNVLVMNNPFIIFAGFAFFAAATAAVLLLMETLSAFLHALRLHWVEFQNKFYHGDGVSFRPFDFAKLE